MFSDSKAKFRSRDTIASIAAKARESAKLVNDININLADYLYGFLRLRLNPPLDIIIGENIEKNADAFVNFTNDNKITLYVRNVIWLQAKSNFPNARFIMAHEVGHILMHKNDALAYSAAPYSVVRALSEEERVEPQANLFAEEFLAPTNMLFGLNNVYDIADYFNIPEECARRQLERFLDDQRRRGLAEPYRDMCPKCGSLTLATNGKCSNAIACQ